MQFLITLSCKHYAAAPVGLSISWPWQQGEAPTSPRMKAAGALHRCEAVLFELQIQPLKPISTSAWQDSKVVQHLSTGPASFCLQFCVGPRQPCDGVFNRRVSGPALAVAIGNLQFRMHAPDRTPARTMPLAHSVTQCDEFHSAGCRAFRKDACTLTTNMPVQYIARYYEFSMNTCRNKALLADVGESRTYEFHSIEGHGEAQPPAAAPK